MKRKSRTPETRKAWGCVAVAAAPLLLLLAFMGFVMMSGRGPGSEHSRAASKDLLAKQEALADAFKDSGSVTFPQAGLTIITLTPNLAFEFNSIEAKEVALNARSRIGGIVRVETPAGQVLAEAP